ncbi:helix-turn-helix transcriptional regulator [Chitinophaga sp. G-6-1-13]|uniref:Helix-turn-helix transcriptional regulator n=1 Tax=Chitinophaga fulva TaxID=2728842 RepID=A0A848H049_9BACT|nr:helix-turn-helix transcriptional regulator [Chitinophaga fulva]
MRHLYHDTLTVKEITYHPGFEDPAYFNRFFRKEMNIPPRQFRQSVKLSAR